MAFVKGPPFELRKKITKLRMKQKEKNKNKKDFLLGR
jgi:hypothetical protein